jgi:hypothetical protein
MRRWRSGRGGEKKVKKWKSRRGEGGENEDEEGIRWRRGG